MPFHLLFRSNVVYGSVLIDTLQKFKENEISNANLIVFQLLAQKLKLSTFISMIWFKNFQVSARPQVEIRFGVSLVQKQLIMGNLCTGDAQQTITGIQDEDQPLENQEEYDDFDYEKIEKPKADIAYDIDNLPAQQRQEKNLAKLQQRIRQMQANQKKGKKFMKVSRKHPAGEPIPSPFILRDQECIYIGQWVYNSTLNSSVPGGIGRLYKEDQIMEGQFLTVFDENDIQASYANKNLSETLIRETSKRAKFFNVDAKKLIAQGTNVKQKIKVILDGEGRIFSRSKQISGTFDHGILHGKGSVVVREEKQVYEYTGEFVKGKKQGKGLEKYKGNVYQGDFRDDKKNGRGILTLFINHKFQQQQRREAQTIQQDNKERDSSKLNSMIQTFIQYRKKHFDQPFEDALKELKWKKPEGALKSKKFLDDSDFLLEHFRRNKFVEYYKGQFKNDLYEGAGRYVWFNGKTYDGTWKAGKMDGYGQFFWHTGGYYYEGEYKDDLKHGKGTMIWGLTKRYRGTWALGFKHGYGELICIDSLKKNVEENVNNNMLSIMNLQKKKPSKITVIGALFNKDDITKEYFKKVIETDIEIDKLATKFIIVNSKVTGVRCDLKDPDADPKQQQEQENKK